MKYFVVALIGIGLAVGATQSCFLPDDFEQAAAPAGGGAGGNGGTGGDGGAPVCPPFLGEPPGACDGQLLDDRHSCCFAGRDCGPDALTNCVNGNCMGYSLFDAGDIGSDNAGAGIVLIGDQLIIARRNQIAGVAGTLFRMPQAGGSPQIIDSNTAWSPTFLATDGTQIFWLNQNSNELWALNSDDEARMVAFVSMGGETGFGRLVVDNDDHVFFASEAGGIWRASTSDDNAMAAPIANATSPVGIALDSNYVYFTERMDPGNVLRVDPNGGTPEPLVTGVDAGPNPTAIVADGGELFWITGEDIRRSDVDGEGMQKLVTIDDFGCANLCEINSIFVDELFVYFSLYDTMTYAGAVYRIPRFGVGGEPFDMSGMIPTPVDLAGSCDRIYAIAYDGDVTVATK